MGFFDKKKKKKPKKSKLSIFDAKNDTKKAGDASPGPGLLSSVFGMGGASPKPAPSKPAPAPVKKVRKRKNDGCMGGKQQFQKYADLGMNFTKIAHQYAIGAVTGPEATKNVNEQNDVLVSFVASNLTPLIVGPMLTPVLGKPAALLVGVIFARYAAYFFQKSVDLGYENACHYLGVDPKDKKKQIERVFNSFDPSNNDGNEKKNMIVFVMKIMAFVVIKQYRMKNGSWDLSILDKLLGK